VAKNTKSAAADLGQALGQSASREKQATKKTNPLGGIFHLMRRGFGLDCPALRRLAKPH
jgi:hypothetical protein